MGNSIVQDRYVQGESLIWANWMSTLSATSCMLCIEQHGKIVSISDTKVNIWVGAHPNCKCIYVPMRTKIAGDATDAGYNGADAQLYYLNRLPGYYIDKKQARKLGWQDHKGNLDTVLPGKMIGGDVYKNRDDKLPSAVGRVWYEADINYVSGYRNSQRILYSNDRLFFVTYDHYQTFYEITH